MIAAFDLGGTFLRSALVGADGGLHQRERLRISNVFDGSSPKDVWDSIVGHIGRYTASHVSAMENDAAVVSFPGPVVDHRPQRAPTISGGYDVSHVIDAVRARTGARTVFLNDVSAAAWHLLDRIPEERFMVLTVSSGIGSKVVNRGVDTHVFDDALYSGEIGHTVVDVAPGAPACDCGGQGHLGGIASGRGTERLARSVAQSDPDTFAASSCATEFGASPLSLNNETHIVPAARAGDSWAWTVIRTAMHPLARVLACVTHAVGLQRIIIIGGFAVEIGQQYGAELTKLMMEYCAPNMFSIPIDRLITVWPADDDACLHGAAKYGRSVA